MAYRKATPEGDDTPKGDIQQDTTNEIIETIANGCPFWKSPYLEGDDSAAQSPMRLLLPLRHNGVPYQDGNALILMGAQMKRGYDAPTWMTIKQANAYGGRVRAGERGVYISQPRPFDVRDPKTNEVMIDPDTGLPEKGISFSPKRVWNVRQIDGLPERFYPKPNVAIADAASGAPAISTAKSDEWMEQFFKTAGVRITEDPARPYGYYSISEDRVGMPPLSKFKSTQGYYQTLAHEAIHWTGAAHRLDRFKEQGFRANAREELVAEIGAAFLMAKTGRMLPNIREDSAPYVKEQLDLLREDKTAIFKAAKEAWKATEYVFERGAPELAKAEKEAAAKANADSTAAFEERKAARAAKPRTGKAAATAKKPARDPFTQDQPAKPARVRSR